MLVWADGDTEQGPLHASFKLSAQGEFIGLFDSKENGLALIDGISFNIQISDVSTGRYPDGTGAFQKMDPSPSSQNISTTSVLEESRFEAITFNPNPFIDHVYILTGETTLRNPEVMVFTTLGELVFRGKLNDQFISLKHLNAGTYTIHLYDNHRLITQSRIVKVNH